MTKLKNWQIGLVVAALIVVAVVVIVVLMQDGDDEDKTDDTVQVPENVVLGLALSTLDNPFFVELRDGAQAEADQQGVTLVVEDAGNDGAQQVTQIEGLIDQGVSAILVNPVDGEMVVPAIEKANAAGIPVFTIDRSAAGGEIVSHIASDNMAGGKMAADFLAESLERSGKVVELKGIEGTSAAEARGAGFNEAMAAYDDIEIIASETANFSRDEGETVFAAILEQYDTIDGVFAHNDEMILGALDAAKAAGRADEIAFVGFDAIDDAIAALEAGDLLATVAQQPAEMGRLGVDTAVKHLNGETVPADIPVELALITR